MPRFLIRRTTDLLPALDEAGLGRARRDSNAFVRLTRKPVDISAIIQKVYLKADEQGSEAAAATAIVDRSITARPSVANSVTFDKPFIFALRRRQVTELCRNVCVIGTAAIAAGSFERGKRGTSHVEQTQSNRIFESK
jgi:serpin B